MTHLDLKTAHDLAAGRLDAVAAAAARRHLDACDACRAAFDEERRLLAVLRLDDEPLRDDPEALGRLMGRLAALAGGGRRRGRRTATILGCALGCVGLVAAAWAYWPLGEARSATARQLDLSARQEREIVARLEALSALETDPWLADAYETVSAFDALCRSDEP